MPKPTEVPAWNTAASNRVTPPLGIQQTGHAPNSIPSSSYENWRANLTGEWCQWVMDGTAANDATAHLVETDSAGHISCLGLEIDGNSGTPDALLEVTNATGAAAEFSGGGAAPTVVINGSTGASSLYVQAGDGQPGIQAVGNGSGPGIFAPAGAGHPGVEARGDSGSPGIEAESSDDASSHGLVTITNVDAIPGVFGLYARCSAAGGTALLGEAAPSGTTDGAGILASGGSASGSGATALRATIVGEGYACELLSPATPRRAPLYLRPIDADPTTMQDGDVWTRDTVGDNEGGMYVRERGFSRGVHATAGGYAGFFGESRSTSSTTSTSPLTKITASFGSYAPKRAGSVRLRAVAEMEKTAASNGVLEIYDVNAGSVVVSRTLEFQAGVPRDVVIETNYTLPVAGARTFRLRYSSAAVASGTISIREASLRCDGVF